MEELEPMDESCRTPPQPNPHRRQQPCWDSPMDMDTNPTFMSTPKATAAKRCRRDDGRINPFDKHLLDRLHQSSWSPSILGNVNVETPPQKNWAIDQIALLNPMSIEDSPSTHQNDTILTPQTEAKAQEAIGRFFSQSSLGPSPPISPISSNSNSNHKWSFEKLSSITGTSTDGVIAPSLPLGDEGEGTTEINTSLPRKLDFSFEFSSDDSYDGVRDLSDYSPPRPGAIIHSPGAQDFDGSSPRHSRIGMESPCTTPIPLARTERPRNGYIKFSSPCESPIGMGSPGTPPTPIVKRPRCFNLPSLSESPIIMGSQRTPVRRSY